MNKFYLSNFAKYNKKSGMSLEKYIKTDVLQSRQGKKNAVNLF
jgi:hypothetical protein